MTVREPLRRRAIVAATRDLIVQDGVEGVSLRRVAVALRVTAPALYAHVSDKRDLLQAVAEAEFEALLERFEAVDHSSPLERMRANARAYIDHARANPELFRLMFLFSPQIAEANPGCGDVPVATRAFDVPAGAVSAAMAAGLITDADPMVTALTTWAAVHGVAMILQLGFKFDDATEEALIESVIEMMIAGLSTSARGVPSSGNPDLQ